MTTSATRTLLTALLTALSTTPTTTTTTTTTTTFPTAAADHHHQLLSLHCLLPTTFLPALDLLERGLAARAAHVYYISSLAPPSPRYQVRPYAWSCECATFTFAAMGAAEQTAMTAQEVEREEMVVWGGSAREAVPPVCKHLVAAALAEWGGELFSRFVREEGGGKEEAAERAVRWE